MPHIAEIKEIDGTIWVKVLPQDWGREGGHGSIALLSETEIKQIKLNTLREFRNELDKKIDEIMKEIY